MIGLEAAKCQFSLFQDYPLESDQASERVIEEALKALNPDELSPKEALEQLYRLRGLLKG